MKGLETSLIVTKELVYFCDLLLLYYIFVYPVKSCYLHYIWLIRNQLISNVMLHTEKSKKLNLIKENSLRTCLISK